MQPLELARDDQSQHIAHGVDIGRFEHLIGIGEVDDRAVVIDRVDGRRQMVIVRDGQSQTWLRQIADQHFQAVAGHTDVPHVRLEIG